MAKTKEELKEMFSTGKTPTGADFADLIDGVEGPQGPAGKDGKDGKDGAKGKPGVDGKDADPQFTPEQVSALLALLEE